MRIPWNKGIKLSEIPRYSKMGFQKGHPVFGGASTQFKHGMSAHFTPHTEETKRKVSESRKGKSVGENNPSWKGGITPLIIKLRRLTEYKEWQKAVFARDNHTCRKCGVRGGNLTPHHLFAFSFLIWSFGIKTVEQAREERGLWNKRNGVTLCDDCHKQTSNYAWRASKRPRDRYIYGPIVAALFLLSLIIPTPTNAATFGYTSAGASNSSIANVIGGSVFSAPEAGTVTQMNAYIGNGPDGGANFLTGIYDTSYNLIMNGGTTAVSNPTPLTFVTFTFAANPAITATDYVLIAHASNASFNSETLYYDAGTTNQGLTDANTYTGSALSSFASPTLNNNKYSIYATYTASGGSDTPPESPAAIFEGRSILEGKVIIE
jgi:hypothetical protein